MAGRLPEGKRLQRITGQVVERLRRLKSEQAAEQMKRAARMLKDHLDGVLNAIERGARPEQGPGEAPNCRRW